MAKVQRLANGSYEVASHTGNGAVYRISLEPHPSCTCPHFQKRLAVSWEGQEGEICKHIEDVLIAEGRMKETDRKNGNKNDPWLSKKGYQMDEVVSSLQKSIRRGLEFEAGFWALELIDSGYWRYLMDRLQTIAAEDIGLADPQAMVLVNAVRQGIETKWSEGERRGKKWFSVPKEQIGFLILYLCRAPKSRMADDFICFVANKRKEGERLEIAEYAVDEHTKRGREKIKQVADEKGMTITRASEEEFYQKGGLLESGDNAEKIGGRNWSRDLFKQIGIPYTGYQLEEGEGEEVK